MIADDCFSFLQLGHGLPNVGQTFPRNQTATPPMPLPFIDRHVPMGDQPMASQYLDGQVNFADNTNWATGSSGSSPYGQGFAHSLPMVDNTVSPQQLHPLSLESYMTRGFQEDDMGVFTFSDSDGPYPSRFLPQPASSPSTSRRRRVVQGQGRGTGLPQHPGFHYGEYDSQLRRLHGHAQQRRPLPSAPGHAAQSGGRSSGGRSAASTRRAPQPAPQPSLPQIQPRPPPLGSILRSSNGGGPGAKHGRADAGSSTGATDTRDREIVPEPDPFPPGQASPGFVPIGQPGKASEAQGNRWNVDRALMQRIILAERDLDNKRGKGKALSYKQINHKYGAWGKAESTLRGIARSYQRPKEHRERKAKWEPQHVSEFCFLFSCLRSFSHCISPHLPSTCPV